MGKALFIAEKPSVAQDREIKGSVEKRRTDPVDDGSRKDLDHGQCDRIMVLREFVDKYHMDCEHQTAHQCQKISEIDREVALQR